MTAQKIRELNISLSILYVIASSELILSNCRTRGVDFDDQEFGFLEEEKSNIKVRTYLDTRHKIASQYCSCSARE